MSGNLVDYRVDNGVAVIELNDPPANTYTYEMNRQLDTAILEARLDDAVHVIVLRGAGDKFFSAGANIKMLSEVTPGFKYYFCLHANETLLRLEQTPKLVIAALNGHTVGGGLEIAMAADMRIARKDAGKIGLPEVTLGVLPGTGRHAAPRAPRRQVEGDRADDRGRPLRVRGGAAPRHRQLGLAGRREWGKWWDRVMDYAHGFCPPNKASKAVGRIKRSVQTGWELPLESALAVERELQQQLFQSEDAKEGLAAYNQKRKAEVQGEVTPSRRRASRASRELFSEGRVAKPALHSNSSTLATRDAIARRPVMITTETAPSALQTQLFINGEFVDAASGATFATINPATEETIAMSRRRAGGRRRGGRARRARSSSRARSGRR